MMRRAVYITALILAGCTPTSAMVPVHAEELAQMRKDSAELRRLEARICETSCFNEVLGTCVIESVEAREPDDNCIPARSRACLMNCAGAP